MRGGLGCGLRSLVGGVVLAAVFLGMPSVHPSGAALSAQAPGSPPTLDAVEAAMGEARFEEARRILEGWWEAAEGGGADREARQRGLWLRGQLTVDPDGAELLYRRLVLEYPGGSYSDQALLRLARGAEARGEPQVAARFLEILVRDYPLSPHRVEARAHLARLPGGGVAEAPQGGRRAGAGVDAGSGAGEGPPRQGVPPTRAEPPAQGDPPVRTGPPPQAPPPVRDDLPTQVPPARDDPPAQATPSTQDAPAPSPAQATGPFTLQFGAFGAESGARALAAELRGAGLQVRVVQVEGSPLYRVRTGGWDARAPAESRARELGLRGFEVLLSSDGDRERPVG